MFRAASANRKRAVADLTALAVLLLCAVSSPSVETVVVSGEEALSEPGVGVRVLSCSESETIIEYTLRHFDRTQVLLEGDTFYRITVPGEASTYERGVPDLPKIVRSVIVSGCARMDVQVMDADFIDLEMPVAPASGPAWRGAPAPVPDREWARPYELDEFYPRSAATLGRPYILRDFRGVTVNVFPVWYNPATRTVRIHTRLVVKVFSSGADGVNAKTGASTAYDRNFREIYEARFLNFSTDRYDPIEERGRLLVISYGDFLDALQPYVDWKRQKGIETDVYDVAAIGSTPDDIRDFITAQYNSPEGLTFVQLVGDADLVPTYLTDIIFFGIHGNSDSMYSLVDGMDEYPDLFVGRFSAESVADVETQVERTIHYERDIAEGDWLHRGAGLGTVWGSGYGYNGWSGVESLEVIRLDLLAYNYTEVAELYEEGVPPFGIIPVEAWEVTEVLHDGIGILNVDGNADVYYLDTGSYTIAHVNALENDYRLPFIHLSAPWCGNFVDDCFAEAWMRATNDVTGAPTGAIAVYTSSNALEYAPPQAAMHETMDLLVGEQMNTIGGLMYNGACWMLDVYGAPGEYEPFRNFNILGDVSLQVRTDTPEPIVVSHDPYILIGETQFTVSTGFEDALVCLSEDHSIIAADYTDAGGSVTLLFDSFVEPTNLTLTVTAYNRVTSTGTVPVIDETGVKDLALAGTRLAFGRPNPFGSETTVGYTLAEPRSVILEIVNVDGRVVRKLARGVLDAGSHTAFWNGRDEDGTPAAGGVYFVRLIAGDDCLTRKLVLLK